MGRVIRFRARARSKTTRSDFGSLVDMIQVLILRWPAYGRALERAIRRLLTELGRTK